MNKIHCPYCRDIHVDTFPCRKAKQAGITKADLPDAYYIDTETGECPPPVDKDTAPQIEKGGAESGQPTNADRERERQARKRAENREEYNARIKRWRDENREHVRARQREYMREFRQRRKS